MTFQMTYLRSTKNTHVYVCDDSCVPTLYINKGALSATPPPIITVKIEAGVTE